MNNELIPPEFRNDDKNIKDITFLNTTYKTERLNKRVLNIDSGIFTNGNTTINFTLDLPEKFRIDKKSDILLDSFTTFNCVTNATTNTIGFLLSFDQFQNNNSHSNTSSIHNKIFVPNDCTTAGATFTHKGKKLNYITTINPMVINNLVLTITLLDGTTGSFTSSDSRFLMELLFVEN